MILSHPASTVGPMTEHPFASTQPVGGDTSTAVATSLRDMYRQLAQLVADVDCGLLDDAQAAEVVEQAASLQKLCGALGALAANRVAQGDTWRTKGHKSPSAWLAKTFGCSVAQGGGVIAAAGRLDGQPGVNRALRSGAISPEQFRIISETVAEAPNAESSLLQAARHESLFRLRHQAEAARAAAVGDDEARHRRARKHRKLRARTTPVGEFELNTTNTVSAGARILQALRVCREELFRDARSGDDRPALEALDADALEMMADIVLGQRAAPTVGGGATKVIVRVDHEALVRGHRLDGEVCEMSGLGPIPVTAAREILQHDDSFLAAVLTKGERVAGVAHLGRGPNAKQRTALEWLHPSCVVQGCDNTILQWDHERNYSAVRKTELENLEGMCGPDHTLKTDHGWRLEAGTGRRRLLPPGHPDHPGDPTAPDPAARGPAASEPAAQAEAEAA
jgi:hypothetical protein